MSQPLIFGGLVPSDAFQVKLLRGEVERLKREVARFKTRERDFEDRKSIWQRVVNRLRREAINDREVSYVCPGCKLQNRTQTPAVLHDVRAREANELHRPGGPIQLPAKTEASPERFSLLEVD